ncbi:MAG TPA: hypothetical protein VNQ76_15145 [Planctomicrobium sp.]|nr:hypothetical protein [Planctomicrobium sp.]
MRRGACLLAMLGFTVQNALGADPYTAGTSRLPASSAVTQSSGSQASGRQSVGPSSQKAVSQPTPATAMPEATGDLKNYYRELFGEAAPTAKGASSLSQTPATDRSPTVRTPNAGPSRSGFTSIEKSTAPAGKNSHPATKPAAEQEIIHAEFRGPTSGQGTIEQVSSERFNARPFPGVFGEGTNLKPLEDAAVSGLPVTEEHGKMSAAPALISPGSGTSGKGAVSFSRGTNAASTTAARPQNNAPTRGDLTSATSSSTTAPSVKVEWQKQTDINVGQECQCHLMVTNVGQSAAQEIEVRAMFPTTVRLINATPEPSQAQSFLGWTFAELKPGETRTIEITMVPLERGDINTRADVRFTGSAEGRFAVAEPMLNIQLEGPKQVLIGESASHLVTVSNPGTGIADRVQIEAVLPEGLEHARGQRLLMELGNLNPGESRSVRLALAATRGGQHKLEVQAKSDAGLIRTAGSEVSVIAPTLAATIQGPSMRFVGRQGVYTLAVTNDGAAATDNVQVRYKIPDGFEFVSADRGAQYDRGTGLLTWFVGRLEKGQKSEIRATLVARQLGEFKHLVRATSEHGTVFDAECATAVEGTSSLSIAVKDTEDPVEVGSQTTYEIRVKNEGSASARSVGLTCEMPSNMTLLTADGPSASVAEGATILFRALPELAAGQTVTYRVKVSAQSAGSLRFRALLTSESIDEPLAAEELTKFYGEN